MNRRIFLVSLILLAGCSPRRDSSPGQSANQPSRRGTSLGRTDDEYVMLIALDLSGSFKQRIAESGEGYQFLTRVIDRFFRDRIGTADKLIIAQIGSERSLLWEGTPTELRKQFPTPDGFRDFLLKNAQPGGRRVYDGLRHALEYLFSEPRVAAGSVKVAAFVLSDLIDDTPEKDKEKAESYLNHYLAQLAWRNGAVGLYFVDQGEVLKWRHKLQFYGAKNYRVEPHTVRQPQLPSFD